MAATESPQKLKFTGKDYDRLWKVENPRDALVTIREEKQCDALTAMKEIINPDSLHVLPHCYIEKFAQGMKPLTYLQFQRIGYFNVDKDSTPDKMVSRSCSRKTPFQHD